MQVMIDSMKEESNAAYKHIAIAYNWENFTYNSWYNSGCILHKCITFHNIISLMLMLSLQSIDAEKIWHITKATLLATISTLFLIFQQTRHTLYQTRASFISYQQERNKASAASEAAAKTKKTKKKSSSTKSNEEGGSFVIGIFHPYCSAGGGGERVLWKAVQALGEMKEGKMISATNQRRGKTAEAEKKVANIILPEDDVRLRNCKNLSVVIYTVDEPTENYDKEVLEKVRQRFSITIPSSLSIHFVHLHEVKYLLNKPKRFTMIAESWGTMKLAWYALSVVPPHVYIDTTGCAFTFFVARILAGCKVGTYVHYPTISTDMLSFVWERRPSYNNNTQIASNPLVTCVKLVYYTIFAIWYGLIGSLANLTMVNSSWTKGHIQSIWKFAGEVHIVYPPVDTKSLKDLPLTKFENMILSIGQFRPEKDHPLQLQSFAKLLEIYNDNEAKQKRSGTPTLVLIGSCRGDDDQERVDQLQKLARELKIQDHVKFVLNEPYSVLKEYLGMASVGIHTMWNEHFGIGVVEMMAAGLVTVAHNSGGPKSDIILKPWQFGNNKEDGSSATGCLAGSVEEYATAMYEILKRGASSEETMSIRKNGRKSAERFSDEVFMDSFKSTMLSSSLFK